MFLFVQFLFCGVLCIFIYCSSSQDLKYKIIAPKFICENISHSVIRLIGEDVPKLKYNWTVSFKLDESIESKNLSQRQVFIVWKSVRRLNEILQSTSKHEINRGLIHINNTLLIPNIKYVINVTVEKQENNTIKTSKQQIILEYIDKSSKKSTLSVSLFGPKNIYSEMPYTAKMEISSCFNNSDYQLTWQVFHKSKSILHKTSSRSYTLHLPPGFFSSGKNYSIKCTVLDRKYNKNKSSKVLQLNILQRGLQLTTYIKHLRIGAKQPIYLNAFFSDPDSMAGKLMFEWKCLNTAHKQCPPFQSSNSTELSIPKGFSKPDRYFFTIQAKKGTANISDTCTVEVVDKTLPVIDVENAVTFCNPSDSVKISVNIGRLFLKCTLQWTSVSNVSEYNYIDLNGVPGKPGQLTKLTEDLNEFSKEDINETFFEKQYNLLLPASNDGSWTGLKENSKYLFRLIASCPENNNSKNTSEETFVFSSADIVVHTNKIPLVKSLKISPKSGQAIKTKFHFQTEQPTNINKPLLYKFGVLNKLNKTIYFVEQYDITKVDIILPFYEEKIQSVLEVCDYNNACNSTLGPKVIVKLPNNFTAAETNSLLKEIKTFIMEKDYFNAFTLSSTLLQTTNKMTSNSTFIQFNSAINNITKIEINSLLNATDDTWLQPANNLLKHIKILDTEVHLPQDIFDDILLLRDKISEKQNLLRKKQSKSEKLTAPTRKLLSLRITNKKSKRIVNEINLDEIKDYLEISELAIKRLTDSERVNTEKQKLRDKLQYYIPRICQHLYNNYKTNARIELSTIILDVEKINLARKYNEFIFIPFEMNLAAKLQIGRVLAERYRRQKGMCLGKILFLDDYFNNLQFVYDVKLYSAILEEFLNSQTKNYSVTIEIPVKTPIADNQMFECVIWDTTYWDITKCKTIEEQSGLIKCVCRTLGYFSIIPTERTTIEPTTMSTLPTNSALVTQQYVAETTVLTTVINSAVTTDQSTVIPMKPTLVTQYVTSTEETVERTNDYEIIETSVNSAAVWSVSLLSVGIFTLLLGFLILIRKLQKSTIVQNFQTIEYARYIDEHNLE